jgi:hypothetical protein
MKRLNTPWDTNQPFEAFMYQVEDAMEYASAGQVPITKAMQVKIAYDLLFNTGVFNNKCKVWRRWPHIEQTWDNLKAEFALAHSDNHLVQQQTSQGAGYQGANLMMEGFVTETDLATAAAEDRAILKSLTNTNHDLLQQLAKKDTELNNLRSQMQNQQRGRGTSGKPWPDQK